MNTYSFLNNYREYIKSNNKKKNYIVFDKKNYSANLHNYSLKSKCNDKNNYLYGYFNKDNNITSIKVQNHYKNSFIKEKDKNCTNKTNSCNKILNDNDNNNDIELKNKNIPKYYIYKVTKS